MWNWSLEQNVVLTLSLLTQHIVSNCVGVSVAFSDQSSVFMQDKVREEELKWIEMEQTLAGMSKLEKLVMGMGALVSS